MGRVVPPGRASWSSLFVDVAKVLIFRTGLRRRRSEVMVKGVLRVHLDIASSPTHDLPAEVVVPTQADC